MLKKHALAVLAAGSALVAMPASAADIVVNQWYTFGFGGVDSDLVGGAGFVTGVNPLSIAAPDGPWTFTLAGPGTLTLLDGFNYGDQFEVSDFGGVIGSTSAPGAGGSCGSDITLCLNTPESSKGVFALGAGGHSITGTALLSPFGGGAGFFVVQESAVPEPGVWLMLLVGFGFVGASLRRRRQTIRVRYA